MSKSVPLVPTLAQWLVRETNNKFIQFHICSNKEINKNQEYLTKTNKTKQTKWDPTEKSLMLKNDMLPIISFLPKELGFEPDRVFVEQNRA